MGRIFGKTVKSNMYSKIGQQKDIITNLKGVKYKDNPEINVIDLKKLENISDDTSGTRTMILSRYLGLLDKDKERPNKVFDEICKNQ